MFLFNQLDRMQAAPSIPYRRVLRCYPVAFNTETHVDVSEAETGGKIFLPQSALEYLLQQRISYPMHFMVRNPRTSLFTHCGVSEFTAPEGVCYLPPWMMDQICAETGDTVEVAYTVLPRGTGVKLQPCTKDFLEITDHRAVLEIMMTKYSALTVGDVFAFKYNKHEYHIEVRDVQPRNPQNSINIVEADLAVEFDPPKDMIPEGYTPPQVSSPLSDTAPPGERRARRKNGDKKKKKRKMSQKRKREDSESTLDAVLPVDGVSEPSALTRESSNSEDAEISKGFTPFSGVGHTLSSDNTVPLTRTYSSTVSSSSSSSSIHRADSGTTFVPFSGEAHTVGGPSSSSSSSTPSFSPSRATLTRSQPLPAPSSQPTTPKRFVPFGGEGHRLG